MRKIFFLIIIAAVAYGFILLRGNENSRINVLKGNIISYVDKTRKDSRFLNTQDFSNKNLSVFPVEVLKMKDTKILNLSHNNLKSLPAEIGELVNLEELYLDHNQLTGALPAEIRKMTKLKKLDVSDNKLTGIPAEIGQLNNLKRLDLSNNLLNTMPNEIFNLKDTLEVLNLFGNKYSVDQIIDLGGKFTKINVNF